MEAGIKAYNEYYETWHSFLVVYKESIFKKVINKIKRTWPIL